MPRLVLFLLLLPALSSAFVFSVPSFALRNPVSAKNSLPRPPVAQRGCSRLAAPIVMQAATTGSDVKTAYLEALKAAGGEPTEEKVMALMEELCGTYKGLSKPLVESHSGHWVTVSNYFGPQDIGKNAAGDNIYTLGRMSFNMFKPKDLQCSMQPVTNAVKKAEAPPKYVPKGLEEDVKTADLLSYILQVPYTVEDDRGKGLKGVMTNFGYALPDPDTPNRMTIFFTGGESRPADAADIAKWREQFGEAQGKMGFRDKVTSWLGGQMMGLQVPTGIDSLGVARYAFKKPIGGHGKTFLDVLYLDDDLRIARGNKGSITVLTKTSTEGL
mmetsp:Transcript_3920/g.9254  ORF Transcript_3920/g.9254 Transcript_3920/m.9254 type:complete len:328 (-) Transcript_3920:164-1147(-)